MYNTDNQVLGTSAVVIPAVAGLILPESIAIYVVIALFLIITTFFFIQRFRNRK